MKTLTIELTTECQIECNYCSSAYNYDTSISNSEVFSILKDCKKEFDVVRFSGGEPTLHPGLRLFTRCAKKLDYKTILLTNGIEYFEDENIDEYHIHWNELTRLKAGPTISTHISQGHKTIINVVNVSVNIINQAIQLGILYDVHVHIMKLQNTGNARKNKLKELNISMSSENNCKINDKKTVMPNLKVIQCASEKNNNKCNQL